MGTKNLQTEFSDDDLKLGYSHFSYYDYLEQCKENGNYESFKKTLKELDNKAVMNYLKLEEDNVHQGRSSKARWQSAIQEEALSRMN